MSKKPVREDGTKIWQYALVIRGARLGSECVVGACAVVDGAEVGDRCHIGHGAQVHPGVKLGNEVFVGPGAVLCNDAWPRAHKRGWERPERPVIVVKDRASIGANAVVLPGVVIGEGAMIAAGSVVSRSVPPKHLHRVNGQVEPITDEETKCAGRMREAGALTR